MQVLLMDFKLSFHFKKLFVTCNYVRTHAVIPVLVIKLYML